MVTVICLVLNFLVSMYIPLYHISDIIYINNALAFLITGREVKEKIMKINRPTMEPCGTARSPMLHELLCLELLDTYHSDKIWTIQKMYH